MRYHDGELLHSASDLNAFLGCAHAAALNLRKLRDPASLPDRAKDDETMVLIQDAGHAHEADYLTRLREKGGLVEIAADGSLEERSVQTRDAMQSGAAYIYQATLLDSPWHGFADFLRRAGTSETGEPLYEVIDTKLSRTPSPKHVLQLALYSQMIAKVQGTQPHEMHLVLGDGREVSFRRVEFAHFLEAAQERYLAFIASGAEGSRPEPCSACGLCGWREVCDAQWKAEDHLHQVAGIQTSQIAKLRNAEITTVATLGALDPGTRIPGLAPRTFERLRAQAALQIARRSGEPAAELLPIEPGRGFARMPEPNPHDLFFDLEGDPLHPDGLEYLWGVHYRDAAGTPVFRHAWGHDRAGERAAFESMVDFFTEHCARYPDAHIYHYAPYEVTVLRRLSTAFASREAAVDNLLRGEKLIDLYAVVRGAIRTSEPDLSLKTLEIFFADKRDEDVTKADQSIVHYHRWRETGDQALLDGLLAYNKVDCENTEGLRDWLVSIRPDVPWWVKSEPAKTPEKSEEDARREERLEELRRAIRQRDDLLSEPGRELAAHLLDFHTRAKKPEQWAIFDRCEREEDELLDDGECVGDIAPAGEEWVRVEKQSYVATYRYPAQDTKLREGKAVLHAPTLEKLGTIFSIDREAGLIDVKRGKKSGADFPVSGAIIPSWPLDTSILEAAIERVVEHWATSDRPFTSQQTEPDTRPSRYRAIAHLIERAPPQLYGWTGGPLVREGETLIEAATARALALDHSTLFIQGPPGTGKTHTSAHVILSLIEAGKRVGVSSNSHKAVNNLLAKIEEVAGEKGIHVFGAKKVTASEPDSFLNGAMISDVAENADVEEGGFDLIGGTAWLFARPALNQQLDYLFVDEAGQVSLGHLMAMGAAARNIILVGDQMQLGQPIQGAHPGESGLSVLDYLLQGAATIDPERGILLDTSWRMHPAIQGFISEAVYDGRLKAHADCVRQTLLLPETPDPVIIPHGIRMVPVSHEGCRQSSVEEAELAADLIEHLLGLEFIDRSGERGAIGLENIRVVAPFNMQVNLLKDVLPLGTQVGTVDKFQGQEAEVVIVSMTTSSPDDLLRHVDFFYSKNRLNVAVSRARTLAIVLANPRLLELDATTVEHLKLVNTLAWLKHKASA